MPELREIKNNYITSSMCYHVNVSATLTITEMEKPMKNSEVNFKDLVSTCIERHVDFEVWHGTTTSKDATIRRQMLISFANAPTLFLTFGDAAHGELLSVMRVSSNKKLNVTPDELFQAIENNFTPQLWSTNSLERDTLAEGALAVEDANLRTVRIFGNVQELLSVSESGEHSYSFELLTHYRTSSGEFYTSNSQIILKSLEPKAINEKIDTTAIYSYPGTVSIDNI